MPWLDFAPEAVMRVPQLDLRAQYETIRQDVEPCLLRVAESQSFVLGPEVEALEAEIGSYVRAEHAIACANGTDALLLALVACGIGPGDMVITSAFSFIAAAEVIAFLGATPVFVDVRPDTLNLDPDALERAITARIKAIVPVDLFGQCADMRAILGIADLHGIPVIEDAAQSLGAEHRGQRAGEMAPYTTFSFYPSKNLGAFGDGGLLTVRDAKQAAVVRSLRVHGESERYVHWQVGMNSRLDALQAAVLRIKLQHLDDWTERRQSHAADYTQRLGERGLLAQVRPLDTSPDSTRHVFNQYTVRVRQRDALRAYLEEQGIGTAVYYPRPLHRQPCFQGLGLVSLPESERAAAEVLSLPLYPELSEEQRAYVIECIEAFYSRGGDA